MGQNDVLAQASAERVGDAFGQPARVHEDQRSAVRRGSARAMRS